MKATMVEINNDSGEWVWYKVTARLDPKEALLEYCDENDLLSDTERLCECKIEPDKETGVLMVDDTVRAYTIEIEEPEIAEIMKKLESKSRGYLEKLRQQLEDDSP